MFIYLDINNIIIDATEDEKYELTLKIVEEKEHYHIIKWLKERMV